LTAAPFWRVLRHVQHQPAGHLEFP
jgi:hypothetical protein